MQIREMVEIPLNWVLLPILDSACRVLIVEHRDNSVSMFATERYESMTHFLSTNLYEDKTSKKQARLGNDASGLCICVY